MKRTLRRNRRRVWVAPEARRQLRNILSEVATASRERRGPEVRRFSWQRFRGCFPVGLKAVSSGNQLKKSQFQREVSRSAAPKIRSMTILIAIGGIVN